MDSVAFLKKVQANVSQERRRLDDRYWRVNRPGWCKKDDELRLFFDDQELLIRRGEVVWGVAVQANSTLFEPPSQGSAGAPGTVIYTREVDENTLQFLRQLTPQLYKLRSRQHQKDEAQVEYGNMLEDEYERAMGWLVPESMTDGAEVLSTTVWFPRKHLECKQLALTYFPLLIHPETDAAMLVPSRCWPPGFKQRWHEEAVEVFDDDEAPTAADVAVVGSTDRMVISLGWLVSLKGAFLTFMAVVMLFVSWREMAYHGQDTAVAVDDSNVAGIEDGTFVTGSLRLDYSKALRATKGRVLLKEYLLVPVVGHERHVIVSFYDGADTGGAEILEEQVTGRASRKSATGHWEAGEGRLNLARIFERNKRELGANPVLIADGVEPVGATRYVLLLLASLAALGYVGWRIARGIRFIVNSEYFAAFLGSRGH